MTSDKSRLYSAMRCIEEVLMDRKLKAGPALRKIKGIVAVAKSELPSWPNAPALPPQRSGGRQEQVVGGLS